MDGLIRYIEGDITTSERVRWEANFDEVPDTLTTEEKDAFLAELTGVSLSSDAFFPFRDSIDHASKVQEDVERRFPLGGIHVGGCDSKGRFLCFCVARNATEKLCVSHVLCLSRVVLEDFVDDRWLLRSEIFCDRAR